ncbi:unnamed protein product [Sphagnum jensenii]|uniref:Protein kinase domain-containing protein n=1 Tax=Sphagnum jensenii TaxID=128206 RepID=A0ABP0WYH1_9BRYO
MDLDQIQLHNHLCNYLYKWVGKTKLVIEYHKRASIRRATNSQERAFREVELVVKRAEDLLLKCMCRQSSWLEAAITLANIKEEVLDIVLDLSFWKRMLKIAIAAPNMGESTVLQYAAKAVEKDDELYEKLLEEGSSLQKAAGHDMSHLFTKLLEVKEKHASGGEGSTASVQEREYILSIYLLSCIEDDDRIATEVESQLKDIKWGEPLGSGGFGQVSEVTWLQQPCAVKRIHNGDPKEVKISRGCNHPHIVQFFWFWEQERTSNIIMERMPEDLYKHIQRLVERNGGRPFQLHVAIDIMLQIAKAMRYLHKKKPKKIVHRDLKTSNILVQPLADNSQGYVHVKLADFGISKFYNMSETSSSLTFRKGTSVYAAPEVFNEQSKYGSKSSNLPPKIDVWSFAMVCSEILTGTVPFDGEPKVNLHAKIEENDDFRPPLPSDCPEDLRFCITRCWECNPRERPTFVEICKMLKMAKAQSLGIMHFDSSKLLVSINDPMLKKPRSRLPICEPQAAGSAGDSNAGKTRGLQKTPVDVCQHQQHHPATFLQIQGLVQLTAELKAKEEGINLVAGEGWNPVRSLHVQVADLLESLRAQHAELKAKEEEIKNFWALEKEMKLQWNQFQMENEKLLDQILHLEHQYFAKSSQGGLYLDDSEAATPALLVTAINTVRNIGKKFTKEFMDQLKKRPEKGLPFYYYKMQSAVPTDDITSNSKVGLVVLPGFQVSQSIIACEVYLVEHA